jgi:hypothetical protein
LFGTTKVKPVIPQPGELTWGFRLGDRVKDKINGIEGVAMGRIFHLSGCDRFVVEQDVVDGEAKHYHCDGSRLELHTAFPDRHRNELPDGRVRLGDKVRDITSGLTGTAAIISVPLIGAVQIDIQPLYDAKTNKMPEGYFVDEHLVEVLTPYTPAEKAAEPVVEKTEAPKVKGRGSMRMGKGLKL